MAKGYEDREVRLVMEWAGGRFPKARQIFRYRINQPPPYVPPGWTEEQAVRLYKPTGFMVDAVVEHPNITWVVEAKTDNESQAIGQLLFYVYLIKKHASMQEFDTRNVAPLILLARDNPQIEEFARSVGVVVEVYSPPWIRDFLKNGYVSRVL